MTELRLRSESLEWREIEDEVIAIDIRNSSYLSANGSGLVLWRELAEGTTRELLIERLAETFGIEIDRAAADVDHFLADLRSRGLLEG
jgi:coenzyme PQQ synthesis protein D (PqqD)